MKSTFLLLLLAIAELGSCTRFAYRDQAPEKSKDGDNECTVCEVTINQLIMALQNSATQNELRTAVEHVCTLLPSQLQPSCRQYVDTYYQLVITYIAQQNPQTVCQELHLCQTLGSATLLQNNSPLRNIDAHLFTGIFSDKVSADKCNTCKTYFAAFEKYLTDPSFIDALIQYVTKNFCPRVAHEFPDCSDFAQRYVPLFFSLLQQVSPDAVCGFLGFCSTTNNAKVNNDDCSDCQKFIPDAQKLVADPNEQMKIIDLLVKQGCPLLANAFPQCATYLQEYAPLGFQMFVGLSPASVCQAIYWCSSTIPPSINFGKLFIKLQGLMKDSAKVANTKAVAFGASNDPCADCQTFVIDAQKKYADPAEQQKVVDLVVNSVCPALASVFDTCPAYAKEYIPLGFQYLAGFAPPQVCKAADFCTSVSTSPRVLPWQTIKAAKKVGDDCSDCVQFIADAQHFYADPQNQQVVIDLVTGSLCPLITSVLPNCVQLAQQQIPNLFVLFQQQSPSTVCKYIGLCSSLWSLQTPLLKRRPSPLVPVNSQVHRFQMAPQLPESASNDDQMCTDCQNFFTDLLQYYQNPDNQQKVIDELVNQVCPLVTQQFPQCSQVLPEYLPIAFQMLLTLSPEFICTELHFCTSSPSLHFTLRTLLNRFEESSVCTDCSLVVEAVRVVLLSNQTVDSLINVLVSVCNVVAEAGRPMCNAMIRAALHELVYTFKQSTNKQVCGTFFPQCGTPGPARPTPSKRFF